MRTLAVTNQKGGSGKTTTAVSLAAALGERGRRALVVDLDPQASASSWLAVEDGDRGLLEVFADGRNLLELVRGSSAPGVDVIASSPWLVGVEKAVGGQPGAETILRRAFAKLPRDRWEFVLVDCPPSFGLLSISALVACEEVLVPVEARSMALAGLARLLETLELVQDRLNPDLELSGLLACRVDGRTNLSKEVVEILRGQFGKKVFRTVIRENVKLAEAPPHKLPVTLYAKRSPGAEDYRAAAKELERRGKNTKAARA